MLLLPVEGYEIVQQPSLMRTGVLLANLAILGYLVWRLWKTRRRPEQHASRSDIFLPSRLGPLHGDLAMKGRILEIVEIAFEPSRSLETFRLFRSTAERIRHLSDDQRAVRVEAIGGSWNRSPAMHANRWTFTLSLSVFVVGIGVCGQEREAGKRLREPSLVALDFRERTVAEVVRTIENRSGKRVAAFGAMTKGAFPGGDPADLDWRDRKVTLESPAPVPFWEAIDRLAVASRLAYRIADFEVTTGVVFEGEGDPPSPACYAGPFRIGLRAIHEYHENIFLRGPWVKFYPSGLAFPADATELAEAPVDGGPLHVELEVAAEPGLVCRRDGPLRDVKVLDDAGRPIQGFRKEDERQTVLAFASIDGEIAPIVRVPLQRAKGNRTSKSIKTIRGVIPVEIGALQREPAIVIPLGAAEGKTFRGGGAVFTVETDRTEADGRRKLAISCRLTTEDDPAVREARLANLRTYQLRILDDHGMTSQFATRSSGGDGRGTLSFSYEYDPRQRNRGRRPNSATMTSSGFVGRFRSSFTTSPCREPPGGAGMVLARLILVVLCGWADEPAASALVANLAGAGSIHSRGAAGKLEELGRPALPDLYRAREAGDPGNSAPGRAIDRPDRAAAAPPCDQGSARLRECAVIRRGREPEGPDWLSAGPCSR